MLLKKALNTYVSKETQSSSACRLRDSGKPRIRTWLNYARLSKSLRINLCPSRSPMLKENTILKLMPRQI
nr:hypothetical protein Iba_chr05dCG5760 [Ipomoea batatas]